MDFLKGDLVYHIANANPYGFPYTTDKKSSMRVGIVVQVNTSAYQTYSVYWIKDGIVSNHVANHLQLVYNV